MGLFGKKDKEERPPVVHTPAVPKVAAKSSPKDMALDTTYVGKNLTIKGTVSGEGNIIILGSFEGKFDLKGRLKIAQGARIKGNVRAADIYVNGNVERVKLRPPKRFNWTITPESKAASSPL